MRAMQALSVAFVLVLLGAGSVLNLVVLVYVLARCARLTPWRHSPWAAAQHLLALADR
jgi:hypothetical protein